MQITLERDSSAHSDLSRVLLKQASLAATGLMGPWVVAQVATDPTIYALLPFDGPLDLIRKPGNASEVRTQV